MTFRHCFYCLLDPQQVCSYKVYIQKEMNSGQLNFCDLLVAWVVVRKWWAMVIQMRRIRKTGMRQVRKEVQRTQNCCEVKLWFWPTIHRNSFSLLQNKWVQIVKLWSCLFFVHWIFASKCFLTLWKGIPQAQPLPSMAALMVVSQRRGRVGRRAESQATATHLRRSEVVSRAKS